MKKKSQAAMEFLMTYGWALVVVFIAIGALTYFGFLNPDRFLPDKAELGPGIIVKGVVVDETKVTLIVSNGLGKTMKDFQINISSCYDGLGSVSEPLTISEGETQKIEIPCGGQIAGTKLKTDLTFHYSLKTAGRTLEHKSTGRIVSSVNEGGKCTFNLDCDAGETCIYGTCWSNVAAFFALDGDVTDSSTNDLSATNHGATPHSTNYSFDGSNDYIEIDHDATLDITEELTVVVWVKSSGDGAYIVSKSLG